MAYGQKAPTLTAEQLKAAEARLRDGETKEQVGRRYGLSGGQLISRLGKRWPAISEHRRQQRAGKIRECTSAGTITNPNARGRR